MAIILRNKKGQIVKTTATMGMLGKKHSRKTKEKMRKSALANPHGSINSGSFKKGQTAPNKGKKIWEEKEHPKGMLGKCHSEETKYKMSESRMGLNAGSKHYRWNPDREAVKQDRRNDGGYKEWRNQVWKRDNWKCKIANQDCEGRIEAHHILGWKEHTELRYEVNNGITLCHFHHPKKRVDEQKFLPFFQGLVGVRAN